MWIVWLSNKLLWPTISQWGHNYKNIIQIKKIKRSTVSQENRKKFSCTPRLLQRSSTAPHLRSLSHTNVCTRLRDLSRWCMLVLASCNDACIFNRRCYVCQLYLIYTMNNISS